VGLWDPRGITHLNSRALNHTFTPRVKNRSSHWQPKQRAFTIKTQQPAKEGINTDQSNNMSTHHSESWRRLEERVWTKQHNANSSLEPWSQDCDCTGFVSLDTLSPSSDVWVKYLMCPLTHWKVLVGIRVRGQVLLGRNFGWKVGWGVILGETNWGNLTGCAEVGVVVSCTGEKTPANTVFSTGAADNS
jgi:hypothetical protein